MINKYGPLHIEIGDNGYHLSTNSGEASYTLNGIPTLKMGFLDGDNLPDKLVITDRRSLPSAINVSATPALWGAKVEWEWSKEADRKWRAIVKAEWEIDGFPYAQGKRISFPDCDYNVSGLPAGQECKVTVTLVDGDGRKSKPVELTARASDDASEILADVNSPFELDKSGQVFINDALIGGTVHYVDMKIGVNLDSDEVRLKEFQQQIDKLVTERIKKELRPGGCLHSHANGNLGGFARDCAARFAGSTMLPFGGFPNPNRKLAVTISGLEQWDKGIVSGATVKVDIVQKGKTIHSEVFSGKSTAEFTREVTVLASFDDIIAVHNRPDLPSLKVAAKFI